MKVSSKLVKMDFVFGKIERKDQYLIIHSHPESTMPAKVRMDAIDLWAFVKEYGKDKIDLQNYRKQVRYSYIYLIEEGRCDDILKLQDIPEYRIDVAMNEDDIEIVTDLYRACD